ncbi:MAG: hypothetical protein JWO76_3591 [Nocardioides sp.]|nr:hypothetical protein [Nocardioides sp.]
MRLAVESGSYVSACSDFYEANHGIVDLMTSLAGALDGGAAMAGTDTGGAEFAAQYDQAAASLLQGGCDLGDALANAANLLNASLVNHEAADHGAIVNGGPLGGGSTGDTNPDHWTESLSASAPPSAAGGTGDQPGWWHWIASHVEGLLWPDADTGRLRSTGDAWIDAGKQLSTWSWTVDSARATIETQRSPEVATPSPPAPTSATASRPWPTPSARSARPATSTPTRWTRTTTRSSTSSFPSSSGRWRSRPAVQSWGPSPLALARGLLRPPREPKSPMLRARWCESFVTWSSWPGSVPRGSARSSPGPPR